MGDEVNNGFVVNVVEKIIAAARNNERSILDSLSEAISNGELTDAQKVGIIASKLSLGGGMHGGG